MQSQPGMDFSESEKRNRIPGKQFQFLQEAEGEGTEDDEDIDGDEKDLMKERIAKKLKRDTSANVKSAGGGEVEKKPMSRR